MAAESRHPKRGSGDLPAVTLAGVSRRFGDFVAVDTLNLQIRDGEFFSLLGPSGCGKTTTLRMIAGFVQPTTGEISIMGAPVAGTPPNHRPVNTVFQNYALFPHMTVEKNVAFGLEMARVGRAEIESRVAAALVQVQMADFAARRPAQLSGGQKQRVALARALVNRPKVLLLDEPLGALDLKLRKAMQLELKQIQQEVGITFIYVTHDQEEAMTMSDRIAVMNEGRVRQIGAPRQIYEHPTSRFVADFIGETNFVVGTLVGTGEAATVEVAGVRLQGNAEGQPLQVGQQVTMAVRPEKIHLHADGEPAALGEAEGAVVVPGRVREVSFLGTDTRYHVELAPTVQVVVRMQNFGSRREPRVAVGQPVHLSWLRENAQILTE